MPCCACLPRPLVACRTAAGCGIGVRRTHARTQAFGDEGGGGVARMKKVASLNDTKALDQQYKSGKGLVLVMVLACQACTLPTPLALSIPT